MNGEDRQPKPGFFKSLNLSTEQEKLVTDLNLTESKSANTDKDVEMSDPEKSPKRDVLEDVDMSNIDNEEEEMEANPNLNQSRISDYFPPTKEFANIPKQSCTMKLKLYRQISFIVYSNYCLFLPCLA